MRNYMLIFLEIIIILISILNIISILNTNMAKNIDTCEIHYKGVCYENYYNYY